MQYMSQVIRKYSNGKPIKLDDSKLFQREGFGAYKREDIANNLAKGLEQFIADEKMNEKDAQIFRQIVGQAIEGTRNGQFTKMDTSGIHNTMNWNSSGVTEGKKFLGINVGGQRAFDKSAKTNDGRNNALNALNRFYTKTLDSMSTYNYDDELKAYNDKNPKSKYNANTFLTDEISRRWYGGNGIDWDNFSKNRTEQERRNLIADIYNNSNFDEIFNKYDWSGSNVKGVQDVANLFRAFGTNIANGTLDNADYNSFAALGGTNLDQFLTGIKPKEVSVEDNPRVIKEKALREEAKAKGYDEEAANKYVEAGLLEYDRGVNQEKEEINKEYENQQYLNWVDEYSKNNPFKETIQSGFLPETLTYKPEELGNPIRDFYNNNISNYLNDNLSRDWFKAGNTQHIANQLDFIINKLGYKLPDAGNGFLAIPSTYDFNNYSTIIYNPSTRQYKETSMLATEALKNLFKEYYDKNIAKHKEGGIIKMQFGGDIQDNYNRYLQQSKTEKENREQQQTETKAKSKGRTIQQQKEADRKPGVDGEWTTEDKIILGSIIGDIASMGAAYVPVYGTLASAGLGVGSSLANYGAELSRNGFNLGDLGNLAINLGLDTVGLVPGFGSAAKGSKILKTAAKYLPRILATASLYNTPEVVNSVKKAMTPGVDLTVDDWRNIAEGFKMAIQGGKGIKRTWQAHKLKKDLATGNKILTTLGGKEVSVTPTQLSEIRSHRKLEDQEAALQLLLKDDNLKLAGDLNKRWFNPTGWLPNSNIRNEYDFSKTKKARTSKGDIDVPIIYSNSDKYIAATMQQSTAKIPGWDELTIKYNDWKYGVNKGSKKPTKKQETPKPKKELLALPAPNQVHRTPSREYINVDISRDLGRSNLTGKGVIISSTPVESPDAGTIRTVNAVSSILQPFTNRPKNLPAVIPTSRNAEKVVASRTIQPTKRLDQFIEDQIPGGLVYGRARAKREKEYRDVFHPAAEAEYNKVWDDAIKNKKDFGYEEVTPRRNPYVPPTPTEIYVTPQKSMIDKNARYLWELINSKKSSTAHVKRGELPHKKSNKKKRTSKDTKVKRREWGGLLFKDGGLIPKFESPAGPIRMQAKSKNYFNRNEGLSGYNLGADIDEFLKHGTAEDYVIGFNGREDNYDALTKASGGTYGNRNYISNPLATTVQSGMLTYNPGFDRYIRQNIQGYGVTEGQGTGTDTYLGDRTWERTLGRNITPEQAKYYNDTYLRQRGIEMYDKGDGGYRLRLLNPTLTPNPKDASISKLTSDSEPTILSNSENGLIGTSNTTTENSKGKFSLYPEDVLSLGRMIGGLVTNNRIAKLYKQGLKPTLIDTFENTIPLQGNFLAKSNAEQQASNLQSMAAKPRTSDASLQLAGELEASNKAGQARFQGGLQDAEMFYKTRMLGQQESDAAKARRVEVANKNRAAINAIDAAKKQIDAGRVTANYQQVLAPWLAGIENKYAQNRAMKNQLALETYQNRASSEYDLALAKILEDYKDDSVGRQKALNQLRSEASANLLKERSKLIDSPWLIQFGEKGTKLTYKEKAMLQRAKDFNKRLADDNKQFHKDIMESKREHNKLIMNMSALTAALIKKGMQL